MQKKIQNFEHNWTQNHTQFGKTLWQQEPDFCHYIQSPIPIDLAQKLCTQAQKFKASNQLLQGHWLQPEDLHLTITLPGRLGTHFQKNDLPFMKKTLKDITAQTPSFELEIRDFNVFPTTLFAEVYDSSGRLQQLHETLCNEIPFSQHPEFRYQYYLPHISLAYGVKVKNPLPLNTNRSNKSEVFTLDTLELGRAKWEENALKKVKAATFKLKPDT